MRQGGEQIVKPDVNSSKNREGSRDSRAKFNRNQPENS
jgi:hypothetical protein